MAGPEPIQVILIGIPGAFTPTCDQKHIPSFVREYDRVKAMGFDMVACVATNGECKTLVPRAGQGDTRADA